MYFVFKTQRCQAKIKKFDLCDARTLDKVCFVARMKNAFLVKANGDVAEWLKAAVC